MADTSNYDSFLVYTVYIQSAKNRQKNESLSKNKCLIFYQDLFANVKLSYKLFSVIQTIDETSINQTGRRNIG
jgi:hypothetical protein